MRHSMIWKSVIREIKGSIGRFLAIFAIVALGVGLFSGLKITKADFLLSTTEYLRDTSFYDYRILGELGFSEEQVRFLNDQEDVYAAEGSVMNDAYYLDSGGSQRVGRFHGITQKVNKIVLTEGRMPQKEDECLADSFYYGKGAIGKKIKLISEEEEEELEGFKTKQFTIVGIAKSPLYLQFERGSSSLGTGSIDAFFYVLPEAFDVDYYTEVYVKFRQDFKLYSEDYKEYMRNKKDAWTKIVKEAGKMRFTELPDLILDAKKTLSEKEEEAEKEFDEAWQKLEEARLEIEDAEEKLSDGKEELRKGKEDVDKAKKEVADGKKAIEEKEPELVKAQEELEKGQKKIDDGEKQISEKEAELSAAKTQLETAKMTVQMGEMQYKLTMEGLISEQKTIDSSFKSLEERERTLEIREALASTLGLEEQYAEEFRLERENIKKERENLNKSLEDLNRRYRETLALGEQIESGKKELEENQAKLEEGENALIKAKEELRKGKLELIEGQKKISQGKVELQEGKQELAKAEKEIESAEKTIAEKEKELAEGEEKLADGKKEYSDGLKEYQDARKKYDDKIGKAKEAIQEKEDQLENGIEPKGYLLGRDTNVGYVCFESDSDIVDGIANVFPVFFFLVAALVCVTTMNRMVEEQRTQIGVLKALGYSDGRIMFKFMFYSGSAAVSGAIIGYYAGTRIFPYVIWTVYGIMYEAGPIKFSFSPALAGISLIVSLACSVGTTYLSCHKELESHAAQLMRPKAPKAGKRVFLEYVPFIWKRLSFLRKVAVRNVLRYKKRFFMMVLGIGGCTGLLLTGFGLKDSIAGVADMQFSEIQFHDVAVTLQNKIDDKFLKGLEALREKGLGDYLTCQESSLELVTKEGQKQVTAVILPKGLTQEKLSSFISLRDKKGQPIRKPEKGEAVVTDKMARTFGIQVGEEITLRDSNQKEMQLNVIGIAKNYIFNYVFLDQEGWEQGWSLPYSPKSIYVKVAEGRVVTDLAPKIMKLDGVANVSVTENTVKRFNAMMESMNLIVILITACAAGLAFIVLFNLTNINITERIREIATIKVLGFYSKETALYVFRENFVLTIIGSLVGLLLGKWLHAFVISEINVDMVSFGIRIFPQSYAYSILLTILFSILVSLMMNGRLEAVSMTESLKSVD